MPSDDESDDTDTFLSLRLLRIFMPLAGLVLLARGHLALFATFNRDVMLPKRVSSMLGGAGAMTGMISVVAAIAAAKGLRSQGLDAKSIAAKILQQPRWWKWWYPRPLRRRGDVWDRLPRELRRYRILLGHVRDIRVGSLAPLAVDERVHRSCADDPLLHGLIRARPHPGHGGGGTPYAGGRRPISEAGWARTPRRCRPSSLRRRHGDLLAAAGDGVAAGRPGADAAPSRRRARSRDHAERDRRRRRRADANPLISRHDLERRAATGRPPDSIRSKLPRAGRSGGD